jgi:hypothetical protein
MIVGYNHNIRYKGEVFHVQTEDSGINTPHIITLLYRGGNIIASKKTSYADIVKMGNLNQIVEELMKEQHKDMLRRLKSTEFDAKLGLTGVADAPAAAPVPPAVPTPPTAPTPQAAPSSPVAPPQPAPPLQSVSPSPPPSPTPAPQQAAVVPPAVAARNDQPKKQQSLDDLIFDFLSNGEGRH